MSGTLYFGDNLDVLRDHIRDESVDLIYLDPPFNSAASYNVLFKASDGNQSQSQITAFEDTWHWGEPSEVAFDDVLRCGKNDVASVIRSMRGFLGQSDMMAYLAMMTVRLIELHRVLRNTGSLYLHCDPTASHYLKIVMDSIFGSEMYKSEIIWKRSTSHGNVSRSYGSLYDCILYYTKTNSYKWNQQFQALSESYITSKYTNTDTDGRKWQSVSLRNPSVRPNLQFSFTAKNGNTYHPHPNGWAVGRERLERYDSEQRLHFPGREGGQLRVKQYLDERPGTKLQDVWTDIPALNSQARERLGYPTQKPVALLERILAASSDPGDAVLDPFCGCGTTVHAAEKLKRRWTGIDITPIAVNLISRRLKDAFEGIAFAVRGIPGDMDGARELAARDKFLFQLWACDLVDAQPYREGKKGADGGIDGLIYFKPDGRTTKAAVVSVKGGGNVGVGQIRDLRGTIERLGEPMGVFVTLTPPTAPMVKEAASAGFYDTGTHRVPRLQILTAEQLLAGEKPRLPFGHSTSYRKAAREQKVNAQIGLGL